MHSVLWLVSQRPTTNICIALELDGNVTDIGHTVYFVRTEILSLPQKIFIMFSILILCLYCCSYVYRKSF